MLWKNRFKKVTGGPRPTERQLACYKLFVFFQFAKIARKTSITLAPESLTESNWKYIKHFIVVSQRTSNKHSWLIIFNHIEMHFWPFTLIRQNKQPGRSSIDTNDNSSPNDVKLADTSRSITHTYSLSLTHTHRNVETLVWMCVCVYVYVCAWERERERE